MNVNNIFYIAIPFQGETSEHIIKCNEYSSFLSTTTSVLIIANYIKNSLNIYHVKKYCNFVIKMQSNCNLSTTQNFFLFIFSFSLRYAYLIMIIPIVYRSKLCINKYLYIDARARTVSPLRF